MIFTNGVVGLRVFVMIDIPKSHIKPVTPVLKFIIGELQEIRMGYTAIVLSC